VQRYLAWEELDDGGRPAHDTASADPIEGWETLQELLKERAKIEQHLMKLLGKAPPDPADARETARFPMPIHTAESRMADRRAAQEEERARAAAKRSQERLRLRAREERERLEQKRDAEAAILKAQAQRAADARRAEERRQDHARAVQVHAILRQAWEEQRVGALRNRQEAERLQWSHFMDRKLRCLERASARVARRRADDRKLSARLDSRPRKPKGEDAFNRPPRAARPA
jgi:hypothetical protein